MGHLLINIPCWDSNQKNIPWWDIFQHSILEHVFKHSLMGHISTLLDGNYRSLNFTLLDRSCASHAICCKIAFNRLKSLKAKVPLRHPKKWWPPISIKIGQKTAEIPNFHLKQLLWTFLIQNSFIFEFEIWSHQGVFWLMHTPCPIYITMKTVWMSSFVCHLSNYISVLLFTIGNECETLGKNIFWSFTRTFIHLWFHNFFWEKK